MKSHDTNFLAESLHNTKQLFDNTIKALLHSVVPAEELKPLLENPGGDAWKDVDLDTKVTEHLGADADAILKKIEEIYLSLAKLKEKLPVSEQWILPKNAIAVDANLTGTGCRSLKDRQERLASSEACHQMLHPEPTS